MKRRYFIDRRFLNSRVCLENMRKSVNLKEDYPDRQILLSKIPEGNRFSGWDDVEFDKTTGKTKKVERQNSRPTNVKRKDRIIVSDPDGEGAFLS